MSCDLPLQVCGAHQIESTANITMIEVDEAVEKKDPTGGRGVNSGPGGKLDVKDQSMEEVLESAV